MDASQDAAVPPGRRKLKGDGQHTLADVAQRYCGDVRVAGLLLDLNPHLSAQTPITDDQIVVVPSKTEVLSFCKKLGIQLGFNPQAENGTRARRKWQQMHTGGPVALATTPVPLAIRIDTLLSTGLPMAELAKRLGRTTSINELESAGDMSQPRAQQLATATAQHLWHTEAKRRSSTARSVLATTLRPENLRRLFVASATHPERARALFDGLCLNAALRDAWLKLAPVVRDLDVASKQLAAEERATRELHLRQHEQAALLSEWVAARLDGVEPLAGARGQRIGVAAELAALSSHLQRLKSALDQADAALARAPVSHLRLVARGGDARSLPKPWPLLVGVIDHIDNAHRTTAVSLREWGLAGLVQQQLGQADDSGGVAVRADALRGRGVLLARTNDEGLAIANRLKRTIVALYLLMRPLSQIDGPSAMRTGAQRRGAFEHDITTNAALDGETIAKLVGAALTTAQRAGLPGSQQLSAKHRNAAADAARSFVQPVTLSRRAVSELGRALVVAAIALDVELGGGLDRSTGQEAVTRLAQQHASRILSAASVAL